MKLGLAVDRAAGLWVQSLEQEKTPYEIAASPEASGCPVGVLTEAPVGERRELWKAFHGKGGAVVTTPAGKRALGAQERIFEIDNPSEIEARAGEHCLKQFSWGDSRFVTETVAARPAGPWRRRFVARLKDAFHSKGLPYVRVSHYPAGFEGVFSFRFDLDNHVERDFERFSALAARHREAISCFVNLKSYESYPEALRKLASLGVHVGSHGYVHHVYDRHRQNGWNLDRAESLFAAAGLPKPASFTGPHGLWHPTLQKALEERGYRFSSEFTLDYDDFPFYPVVAGRRSTVLQVPTHPVCEGVFFERHGKSARLVTDYLARVVDEKVSLGEPAILFGHPDGRIGAHPEIFQELMERVRARKNLWVADMDVWAKWRVRREAASLCAETSSQGVTARLAGAQDAALELAWADGSREMRAGADAARPIPIRKAGGTSAAIYAETLAEREAPVSISKRMKQFVKRRLDWETKTPLDGYVRSSARDWLRFVLRAAHDRLRNPEASRAC